MHVAYGGVGLDVCGWAWGGGPKLSSAWLIIVILNGVHKAAHIIIHFPTKCISWDLILLLMASGGGRARQVGRGEIS